MKYIRNLYLSLPKQHQIVISSLTIILLLLLIMPSEDASASKQTNGMSLEVGKRYSVAIPQDSTPTITPQSLLPSAIPSENDENTVGKIVENIIDETLDNNLNADLINSITWQEVKIKSGDSLAKIFNRQGLSHRTTYEVSKAKGEHSKILLKLQVGKKLRLGLNESKKLVEVQYPISKTKTLFVKQESNGYVTHLEEKEVEIRTASAHGNITSSFWHSGVAAGLDDGQIINLANIFGWDIDFALDIRSGDSFHVVYENKYVEGEYIGTGNILSAEFINQNDSFQAIRFTDGEYYTPKGDSMRKAFLRAPVNFKYISSNFKPKRFHPVQKRWKAHRGTDYAARTGTPVVAAGNGKVTHSTYNKYNGNYVFIQHGNGIVTKYLHFSKRAVKAGQRVKQGQVIGYVGATGLAAGPHLHYEFLLNGVHRNPRTVKLPDAQPIDKKYKQEFNQIAQLRLAQLNNSKDTVIVMQENGQ